MAEAYRLYAGTQAARHFARADVCFRKQKQGIVSRHDHEELGH
jgi:hypothetical protein